jgi:hypothetical protein
MHLLLTDRMTCPRCGPDFGLILLAREVRERRIYHGDFGCSNCREQYPVENGFGDLRTPPRSPLGPASLEEGKGPGPGGQDRDADAGLRLAALMGIAEGPGTLLLVGPAALHASAVARLLTGVEVVGVHPALQAMPQEEGVSRMVSRPGIPFFSGTFLGVVYSGASDERMLLDSVRVTAPLGRLAVLDPTPGTRPSMESQGLQILMEEESVLVAKRGGGATAPAFVTLRGP